jgi:hypothetical protein
MTSVEAPQNLIASGSIDFANNCWNNVMFVTEAALHNYWTATSLTSHTIKSKSCVGIVHYKEISTG